MSWPHLLSFSRVVAAPAISILVLLHSGSTYFAAALLFAAASLTDIADGKLARYSQSVSPLGVFLDTTADKVLVSLTLVAMTATALVPAWITLVVIAREFLVSGLRSFAASYDRIISAHIWGKGKAAITMVATTCVLISAAGRKSTPGLNLDRTTWDHLFMLSTAFLVLAAILTVVSGIRYFVDALPLFRIRAVPPPAKRDAHKRIAAGDGR